MSLVMLNVASMLTIATVPPTVLISHEQSQGLRVEWDVQKAVGSSPDTATITIYNLGLAGRKALEVASALPIPLTVQLSVGWGLVPELLFTGQAWEVKPEKKTGTNILSIIEAGDGAFIADVPPSGGAWVGRTAAVAVAFHLQAMGLIPSPAAIAAIAEAGAKLPISAWDDVDDGSPRDKLDDLMATLGLDWGVADGFFVVYRGGLRNDLVPSILMPASGLLSAELLDDGGVEFHALAQARVVPGLQVQILTAGPGGSMLPLGGGPLRVESVTFSGTSEGPSLMTGVARKVTLL